MSSTRTGKIPAWRDARFVSFWNPVSPAWWSGKGFKNSPNGLSRWGEIRAFPVFEEGGRVAFVATIGFDITDRKLAVEKQQGQVATLQRRLEELSLAGARQTAEKILAPPDRTGIPGIEAHRRRPQQHRNCRSPFNKPPYSKNSRYPHFQQARGKRPHRSGNHCSPPETHRLNHTCDFPRLRLGEENCTSLPRMGDFSRFGIC